MAYQPVSPRHRKKSKANVVNSLFAMLLGLMSLSTDAFGTLPPSELSKNFRETLGEVLPAELVESINSYLAQIPSSPNIPIRAGDEIIQQMTEEDLNALAEQIAEEMAAAIVAEQETATAEATSTEEALDPATEGTPESTPEPTGEPTETPPPPPVIYIPPPPPPSNPNNRAPSCQTQDYTNPQTTGTIPIDLSTICSDPDGDTWSITAVTQGANGAISFSGKIINYDPEDGFVGTDSITFTIADSLGASYSQSADIIIINLPPTVGNDSLFIIQNSTNNLISPLTNDSDAGNDTLTIIAINDANITGEALISPDGQSIIYTPLYGSPPNFGYTGIEYLYYTVEDSNGGQNVGAIEFNIYVPMWCGDSLGDANNGCLSSNIRLNGAQQNTLTVNTGETFIFEFDYQIWSVNSGWIHQIITGFNGIPASVCTYNASGLPTSYAAAPVLSSPVHVFTAPNTPGTYYIYAPTDIQFTCANAQANYTDRGEPLSTINVVPAPPPIIMYNAGLYTGNMGGRTGADALCAASQPAGYTKSNAFLSAGTGYAIADMPTNIYGVPTNLPIQSSNGTLIANHWGDLLDGTIQNSMVDAGIVPETTYWWSGTEYSDGTIVAGTAACTEWTQASGLGGNAGDSTTTDGQAWLHFTNATCDTSFYILCIAYP